jgi:hypothetical protein
VDKVTSEHCGAKHILLSVLRNKSADQVFLIESCLYTDTFAIKKDSVFELETGISKPGGGGSKQRNPRLREKVYETFLGPKPDVESLQKLLLPDYLYIQSKGVIWTREENLGSLKSGVVFSSIEITNPPNSLALGRFLSIVAPALWSNSANDFINPPEPEMPRTKFVLIPVSGATRDHGTHTQAAMEG